MGRIGKHQQDERLEGLAWVKKIWQDWKDSRNEMIGGIDQNWKDWHPPDPQTVNTTHTPPQPFLRHTPDILHNG